jgi:hypothetical protein
MTSEIYDCCETAYFRRNHALVSAHPVIDIEGSIEQMARFLK